MPVPALPEVVGALPERARLRANHLKRQTMRFAHLQTRNGCRWQSSVLACALKLSCGCRWPLPVASSTCQKRSHRRCQAAPGRGWRG